MSFIKQKDINTINKKIYENKYKGLIFFISDENYSKYVKPLVSSLNLFAENWLIIYLHVGNFSFNFPYKENLFEITIDLPLQIKNNINLKTYCANIRVPILYEFSTKLDINKIIYSDVDNILITDLHKLFKKKKIFYIRKVNLNFIDKLLNNASKIMHYKSGVIILSNINNVFLRDDKLIMDFVTNYLEFCFEDFDSWFSDQIALSKTFNKITDLKKYSCLEKKICDWDLNPFSIFWAAKGYIKDSILWEIISNKVIFFSNLKRKNIIKKNKNFLNLILFFDSIFNLLIYPLIVVRFRYINFIYRLMRYLFKKIIK